jgi:hypothetical protein
MGGPQAQPQPGPQAQPQALPPPSNQQIASNIAAAQRLGIGAAPPMPGYPQGVGASQPFMPLEQQYQAAQGIPGAGQVQPRGLSRQAPQGLTGQPIVPELSGGGVGPISGPGAPLPGERIGMLDEGGERVPGQGPDSVPEAKTLGTMSEEEFRRYLKDKPLSWQEKKKKERRDEQKDIIAQKNRERELESREERNKQLAKVGNIKEKEAKIKMADKYVEPIQKQIDEINANLPEKLFLNNLQEETIKSGSFGPGSFDHIATRLGLGELASADASGFQFAIKHKMIEGIRDASGRPNMYLENTLVQAAGQVGKSKGANLILAHGAQHLTNIDKAKSEIWERLQDKYLNDPNYGYMPEKAVREYRKELSKVAQEEEKKTLLKFQQDRETEMTTSDLARDKPNEFPAPLTDRRQDAFMLRSINDLTKAQNGKAPTKEQAIKYAQQLAKRNNYIVEK